MAFNIFLTNIQRFSLHDGPGIRTTVFLKGCSLRCPWCSNPENLVKEEQKYVKNGIEKICGKYYSWDEIYREIVKDKEFYGSDKFSDFFITSPSLLNMLPGGVTFSGGECLLQMIELKPLLQKLNEEHIHLAVETCLFVQTHLLLIALEHIDLFYVDIKILEEEKCKSLLHGDLELYFANLFMLMDSGKPIVFRIPVIGGFTDSDENRLKVLKLINEVKANGNILKIELIQEHNYGMNKYRALKEGGNEIIFPNYKGVSDELLEDYKNEIEKVTDIPIEICKN